MRDWRRKCCVAGERRRLRREEVPRVVETVERMARVVVPTMHMFMLPVMKLLTVVMLLNWLRCESHMCAVKIEYIARVNRRKKLGEMVAREVERTREKYLKEERTTSGSG